MRAIQRAIAGVGLALVAVVAMALIVGTPGTPEPDRPNRPATQATGPRIPLADVPPEPVDAAEDTSVGTLPPPADATRATQLASRDLVAPSDAAPNVRPPADGKALGARKARAAERPESSGRSPSMPEQGFTVTQDGWEWSGWDDPDARYADGDRYAAPDSDDSDSDGCRRDRRHELRDDCDDRDDRDDRRD